MHDVESQLSIVITQSIHAELCLIRARQLRFRSDVCQKPER
jgi:hypothetical protein